MQPTTALLFVVGAVGFTVDLLIWLAGARPSALGSVLSQVAFVCVVYLLYRAERRIQSLEAGRG